MDLDFSPVTLLYVSHKPVKQYYDGVLIDDIFNQEILQYLTLNNIVKLDNACMNHEYRPQLLEKIDGVILKGQ